MNQQVESLQNSYEAALKHAHDLKDQADQAKRKKPEDNQDGSLVRFEFFPSQEAAGDDLPVDSPETPI